MGSPSRTLLCTRWMARASTALPAVSRLMLRASRIGTPLPIRVPKVRVKRAMALLFMIVPNSGTWNFSQSTTSLPVRVLVMALTRTKMAIGDGDDDVPVGGHAVGDVQQQLGRPRQLDVQVLEHLDEAGDDELDQAGQDQGRDGEHGHRVDQGRYDLALQPGGLLAELGQALQHDVQHAARLAGLDHVAVEFVEGLRILGHALGEGGAALHLVGHRADDVLQHAGLGLLLQDVEGLHDRDAGVRQRGELAGEHGQVLGAHAADGEGPLAHAPGAAAARGGRRLLLGHLGGPQIHGAHLGQRLVGVAGLDRVDDRLVALHVHRFILEDRHLPPSLRQRPPRGAAGNRTYGFQDSAAVFSKTSARAPRIMRERRARCQ